MRQISWWAKRTPTLIMNMYIRITLCSHLVSRIMIATLSLLMIRVTATSSPITRVGASIPPSKASSGKSSRLALARCLNSMSGTRLTLTAISMSPISILEETLISISRSWIVCRRMNCTFKATTIPLKRSLSLSSSKSATRQSFPEPASLKLRSQTGSGASSSSSIGTRKGSVREFTHKKVKLRKRQSLSGSQ